MNDEEYYQKLCDSYAEMIRNVLNAISAELLHKHGITIFAVAHIAQIVPQINNVRGATYAMGDKTTLFKMVDFLKKDLIKGFGRIEEEKQDVLRKVFCPEKKKFYLN